MKTFDELYKEVIADKSIKATEVFPEITKRYTTQVVAQALKDAAERVTDFEGVNVFVKATIKNTPITLP